MRSIQLSKICKISYGFAFTVSKRWTHFGGVNYDQIKKPNVRLVRERIDRVLTEKLSENEGFEWWPFKVGTYNAEANENVRLHYQHDTLAVLVLNNPHFFENAFRKWLVSQRLPGESAIQFGKRFGHHPIREFFFSKFAEIEKALSPIVVKSICDFEPVIHRSPAVSLPLCGKVSGAAYYYPPNTIIDPATNKTKKRMGIALHAKYGGHFSLRGVIIFPGINLPANFKEAKAIKTLKSESEINDALNLINEHWRNNRYRDCGNPQFRYSDLQLEYFNRMPRHRWELLSDWFKD